MDGKCECNFSGYILFLYCFSSNVSYYSSFALILRADRMAQLLDERDLGVLTSSMSLLVALVSNQHEGYWSCLPKCVKTLERLARNQDIPQEYTYYGIPSPWLQVCKFLLIIKNICVGFGFMKIFKCYSYVLLKLRTKSCELNVILSSKLTLINAQCRSKR